MTVGDGFWKSYYRGVFEKQTSWLDYSNERVQAQTFGLALEAAGPIFGKRCVDVGCGWGQLARTLHDLGATEVTAVDLIADPIAQLAREFPHIRWMCGDFASGQIDLPRASTDVLLMIEVLQYTPFAAALAFAWDLIAPGGRIVAVVPNADCPIVASTKRRFEGRYTPPKIDDVRRLLSALIAVDMWSFRGLIFGDDQRIAPYVLTPWTQTTQWERQPNRLQFVAIKAQK